MKPGKKKKETEATLEQQWRLWNRASVGLCEAVNTWAKSQLSFFSTSLIVSPLSLTSSLVLRFHSLCLHFLAIRTNLRFLMLFSVIDRTGSGSELLVYDLELGEKVGSFFVFQGIRVHGISCCDFLDSQTKRLAVFGERRVKLCSLGVDEKQARVGFDLTMLQCLPKFSSWILDVCFFKVNKQTPQFVGFIRFSNWFFTLFSSYIHLFLLKFSSSLQEESPCLAIGCSDNSVCVWDISKSSIAFQVQSPG